jgi:hypothetical protein
VDIEGIGSLVVDQLGSSVDLPAFKYPALPIPQDHLDVNSALNCGDGGFAIFENGKGASVESEGGMAAKPAKSLAAAVLVRFSNFIAGSASKLGRQAKLFADRIVDEVVKGYLVRQTVVLVGYARDVAASLAEKSHCFGESLLGFGVRLQLDLQGLLQLRHSSFIIFHIGGECKGSRPWWRFLSLLKQGVSSPRSL